jgi:transcriptional regulator with XRE-family HTH domain
MTEKQIKSFYQRVGRQLTVARQQCNISIAHLALKSGQQYKTIQSIESGESKCSLHHIVWISEVLGMDINQLLEGKNERISIDDLI